MCATISCLFYQLLLPRESSPDLTPQKDHATGGPTRCTECSVGTGPVQSELQVGRVHKESAPTHSSACSLGGVTWCCKLHAACAGSELGTPHKESHRKVLINRSDLGRWVLIRWRKKQSSFPWKPAFISLRYLMPKTSVLMALNGPKWHSKCGDSSSRDKWTYFYTWATAQVLYSYCSTRSKTLAGGISGTSKEDCSCFPHPALQCMWSLHQCKMCYLFKGSFMLFSYILSKKHSTSKPGIKHYHNNTTLTEFLLCQSLKSSFQTPYEISAVIIPQCTYGKAGAQYLPKISRLVTVEGAPWTWGSVVLFP